MLSCVPAVFASRFTGWLCSLLAPAGRVHKYALFLILTQQIHRLTAQPLKTPPSQHALAARHRVQGVPSMRARRAAP